MRGAFVITLIGAALWALSVNELNSHGCWAATDFLGTNPRAFSFWCSTSTGFAFLVGSVAGAILTVTAGLYLLIRLVRRGATGR